MKLVCVSGTNLLFFPPDLLTVFHFPVLKFGCQIVVYWLFLKIYVETNKNSNVLFCFVIFISGDPDPDQLK